MNDEKDFQRFVQNQDKENFNLNNEFQQQLMLQDNKQDEIYFNDYEKTFTNDEQNEVIYYSPLKLAEINEIKQNKQSNLFDLTQKTKKKTQILTKCLQNKKKISKTFSLRFLAQVLINTRCTENLIWASSAALGILILFIQVTPIFLRNWVHIIEPRPINQTNNKGELMEASFEFNIGYFYACRKLSINMSEPILFNLKKVNADYSPKCMWNSVFTGEDLPDFGFATNAILARLCESTVLHIFGSFFTILAFILSMYGHLNKSNQTLASAILYFIGGLSVMAGVLQVICVVDDEMYPRKKANIDGEPIKYDFYYGSSFLFAALSFLPIQLCIYLQTSAFFNRFPNPQEKALIVPGLSKLLQQVSVIRSRTHQLGKCSVFSCDSSNENINNNFPKGINASISGTSIGGGSMAGISINFANRQRRESRALSKDFSVFGVYQEVKSVPPSLNESIRCSSYF